MSSQFSRRNFLKSSGGFIAMSVLAACAPAVTPVQQSSSESTESSGGAAVSTAPVALSFWHPFGGARVPLVDAMIAGFQEEHPDIQVTQTLWTGGDRMEKFIASVAGNTTPDSIMFRSHDLPAFVQEGVFLELDSRLSRDGFDADAIFYPSEIAARRYGGVTYALPTVPAAGQDMAFYNVARFEEAGLDPDVTLATWAEWNNAVELFTDNSVDPPKWFGTIDENAGILFNKWLYLNDGKYISDDLSQITFNDETGVETLQWMHDLMAYQGEYSTMRPSSDSAAYIDTMRRRFAGNQTAMYISGPWMFVQFPEEHEMLLEEFRLHPLPYNDAKPNAKPGVATEGGWGNTIPAGGANLDAAWEFVKYATMTPASFQFTSGQQRPSPVREYNMDPRAAEGNPYWSTVIEILEQDTALPITPAWVEIATILQTAQEEALSGAKTPQDALNDAAALAQRAIDRTN